VIEKMELMIEIQAVVETRYAAVLFIGGSFRSYILLRREDVINTVQDQKSY
jgi:hypothetical protein